MKESLLADLHRVVALVAAAIAVGAAASLWNGLAGAAVMVIGVIAVIRVGTRIVKNE